MKREDLVSQLKGGDPWDVVVIGGGATGLGAAVDAAARGYRTLLLEQEDFAKATSSRATKLAHGGVRYLEQGNISLVYEALHERGLMIKNAPHIAHPLAFVIPVYKWMEKPFYGIGLKVYQTMAGKESLGKTLLLSADETVEQLPTVQKMGLRGGVLYMDGQFDDARLAVTLLRTFQDLGGVALNYVRVTGFIKEAGKVAGVLAEDTEGGGAYEIKARGVLNATGIFSDAMRRSDNPKAHESVAVSQGTHIVLDKKFLPGTSALMVPKTEDGRVLFAVPWHRHVIVGTTDLGVDKPVLEPRALDEEKEFLLHHVRKYIAERVEPEDILSIFSGLRPLVKAAPGQSTASLSRDHHIEISDSHLVTINGGKWTTYRRMGEDAINHVAETVGLEPVASKTKDLPLHGARPPGDDDFANLYGTDYPELQKLSQADPALKQPLHEKLPYHAAEVVWGVRHEMARTVEDILSRRTRSLLLNARASIEAAPLVARLLAAELGRDATWQRRQIDQYTQLAEGYLFR
ncbi:MAG: glycerol-3-phosphate dehydrogenase/oxidase [Chthoniobacteraceae bacterium]